jgi:hypothetical protein
VPLRPTTSAAFVDELLVMVSWPLDDPAAVGSNSTLNVAVWLGASVIGKLAPEIEKPLPATLAALTVTDAEPVEDRVIDCVAGEFRFTLPNAMLVAFTLSVETDEPSWRV